MAMAPTFIRLDHDGFCEWDTHARRLNHGLTRRYNDHPQSSFTASQSALLSATSMNRFLARLPTWSLKPASPSTASPHSEIEMIHSRYLQSPPAERGEKSHRCRHGKCDKKFPRLKHLIRHQRTHTAEKPYTCDHQGCGKLFSRSDNLTQHKKTHNRAHRARV